MPRVARATSSIQDLVALVRVAVALGVRDPARREFWSYLRRAVWKHHDNLSEVITLAAMGYHFRKHTEAHHQNGV
jgi:hypothetical protein